MGTALVTLPDGRKARVTFDTPDQLNATIADLTKGGGAQPKGPTAQQTPPAAQPAAAGVAQPGGVGDQILAGANRLGGAVLGAPEAALKVGSGLVGSAAGGVAGLARGAGAGAAALAGGEGLAGARQAFSNEAADTIQGVGEALTYQPQTQGGKDAAAVVEAPFKLLAKGADVAGAKTAELTGSPALGAAVNTAIQSAPALLGVKGGRVAAGAEEGAEAGATGAAAKAKSYAGSIGLDWSRLADETKAHLTNIAKGSGDFSNLDAAAVKREALLKSLRIPVSTTRAKLTQNAVDLRREALASKTDVGEPIRQTDVRANRDIQANLEVLRGRKAGLRGGLHDPTEEGAPAGASVRAPTKLAEDVGSSLQGQIRAKAAASKKNYDALYKKARETEPNAAVSVEPLHEMLEKNPEIQHLGFMQGWLKKAGTREVDADGNVNSRPVTLHELHDLREKAGGIARAGGTDGYYAGQVVRAIDEAMKEVPAGAQAWQAANKAFREHQKEFKDQALISKLVSNKGGDRKLALEKTASTIAKGSLDQIRQVKKTLLTQQGASTARFQGRQAWRDLQGETVNRILEDARNVTGSDEAGRPLLTAVALRKSINSIGRDRLTEILGKSTTDEVFRILRATNISAKGRVTESGTVPNALVLMEKATKHLVPGAKYVVGAKQMVRELGERGRAVSEAQEAVKTPLQVAAEESERRAAERATAMRRRTLTLRGARGAAPGVSDNTRREPPAP